MRTDEDVDVLLATLVRARGFSAATTVEAGNLGQDDQTQLAYAVRQECAFVTHNRADFEDLARAYFAAGRAHHGIIIAARRPPYEVAQRIRQLPDQRTADELDDQVFHL